MNLIYRQSFARLRLPRDLCHLRNWIIALIAAVLVGIPAQVITSERIVHLLETVEEVERLEKWYSALFLAPAPTYPGLIAGAGVFFIVLACLEKFQSLDRYFAERFLPDPPPFVTWRLEDDRADELKWSHPGKPFVGREAELEMLREFADAPETFLIWLIHGASGQGKTHLSAVWLKSLYKRGWDIGTLEENISDKAIDDWRPRAATAFVLDKDSIQSTDWHFLRELARRSRRSKHRTRILILSIYPPDTPSDLSDCWHNHADRKDNYFIRGVSSSFVHQLREAYKKPALSEAEADRVINDTDGLALYTFIKAREPNENPRHVIVERANYALDRAWSLGRTASNVLAMSALLGPIQLQRKAPNQWLILDAAAQATIFPWQRRPRLSIGQRWGISTSDKTQIPAYEPRLEGAELLLLFLARQIRSGNDGAIDGHAVEQFIADAIESAGQPVIDRLLLILRFHPLVDDAWRSTSDTRFWSAPGEYLTEELRQDCIAAILVTDCFVMSRCRDEILGQMRRIASGFYEGAISASSYSHDTIESQWLDFKPRSQLGIGDIELGCLSVQTTVNAVRMWEKMAGVATDKASRLVVVNSMQAAFGYLRTLADDRFPGVREIAAAAALGAANVTNTWEKLAEMATDEVSRSVAINSIQTTFAYLRTLSDVRFSEDREIAERAARGAFNVGSMWAKQAKAASDEASRSVAINSMEESFAYLRELNDGRFPEDRELAVWGARGAVNGLFAWGEAAKVEPLRSVALHSIERTFFYLRRLTDARFPEDIDIAVLAAQGAFHATLPWESQTAATKYKAPRSVALSLMEEIFAYLRGLTDDRFPENREIALEAARSAFNIVCMSGKWAAAATDDASRTAALNSMIEMITFLRELADDRFPEDRMIALEAAKGATNAAHFWADRAKLAMNEASRSVALNSMKVMFAYLREFADDRFHDDREFALSAAKGAVAAASMLQQLAVITIGEVPRSVARNSAEGMFVYLRSLADDRFPEDRDIALLGAHAVANAILVCREVAKSTADEASRSIALSAMEAVFVYLRGLADDRFPKDGQIAVVTAHCAYNAGLTWGEVGNFERQKACRNYLRVLRDRHRHPKINYLASRMNV